MSEPTATDPAAFFPPTVLEHYRGAAVQWDRQVSARVRKILVTFGRGRTVEVTYEKRDDLARTKDGRFQENYTVGSRVYKTLSALIQSERFF